MPRLPRHPCSSSLPGHDVSLRHLVQPACLAVLAQLSHQSEACDHEELTYTA